MPTDDQDKLFDNSELNTKFLNIRKKCKNLMGQARSIGSFKYYVSHDQEHLDKVLDNAIDLSTGFEFKLNDKDNTELNDLEKFILYSACYAHDLGMLKITIVNSDKLLLDDFELSERIRKEHADYAPEMINNYLRYIIDNDTITDWIGRISEIHSSKTSIAEEFDNDGGNNRVYRKSFTVRYDYSKIIIRPILLAAILRLSDALVYSETDTLDNMDIIRNTVSKIEDKMLLDNNCVYNEPYKYLSCNNFCVDYNDINVFDPDEYYKIKFLYKQIIEYWKHAVVKNVHIDPDFDRDSIDINVKFNSIQVPKLCIIENDISSTIDFVDSVKDKFKEEITDKEKGVKSIFQYYGINLECQFL